MDSHKSDDPRSIQTVMDAIRPYSVDYATTVTQYPFIDLYKSILGEPPSLATLYPLFQPIVGAQFMMTSCIQAGQVQLSHTALVLHASSEAANCTYCMLHGCYILKRSNVPLDHVTEDTPATIPGALRAFGASLGTLPTTTTPSIISSVLDHFTSVELERLALSVGVMGYLNAKNDFLKTDLERTMIASVQDYLDATGWSSPNPRAKQSLGTASSGWMENIRRLFLGLQWTMFRTRAQWGIPSSSPQLDDYMTNILGASFSIFDDIQFPEVRVSIAYVICQYVTSGHCIFPRALKYAVGIAFATRANNEKLRNEMSILYGIEHEKDYKYPLDFGEQLCDTLTEADECGTNDEWVLHVATKLRKNAKYIERDILGLLISLSMCYIPSRTCPQLARFLSEGISDITAGGVMEMTVWGSTLMMLNRMMTFYRVRRAMSK